MNKQDEQLTRNHKNAMPDDPKEGARHSETLDRDGAASPLQKAPARDVRDKERIDAFGAEKEARERANG